MNHPKSYSRLLRGACLGAAFIFSVALAAAGEQGLGRTWAKLDRDKELVIGYFGGSITAGAGASNASQTSWRALTTAWFKKQFPNAKITEINAAIGGTGSELGAYRCKRDLLSKRPNLVFVEFAVNDAKVPEEKELASMEGIVRQILSADPATEIVFVYTTTKAAETYSQGADPQTVVCQQRLADYYSIPSVNIGKVLWEAIRDGKGTWETLTKDGVHPLDVGYVIYADKVAEFLSARRQDQPQAPLAALPKPLSPSPLESAHMDDAWEVNAPGWTKENASLGSVYPHRLSCNTPGTELTYAFSGPSIGVYWLLAPDSGSIDYSIDDGPSKTIPSWDKYALHSSRAGSRMLADGLTPGQHVLHLKVSASKAEESTGTWVRIGAFMVR